MGWQIRLYRQIAAASRVFERKFGVQLELVEAKEWPGTHRVDRLESLLVELGRLDPGRDVDLVLGLVTALPLATSSMHRLGMSELLGRHLVLCAMDDAVEHQALIEALHHLPESERDRVYTARLRHKEIVVLLHEIGHALGAIHSGDSEEIMNAEYGPERSRFSEPSAGAIEIALGAHLAGKTEAATKQELLDYYQQRGTSPAWADVDRDQLIAYLGGRGPAPSLDPAPEFHFEKTDTPKDPAERAAKLASRGDFGEAWRELSPVVGARAGDAKIQSLACELGVRTATGSDLALKACENAAKADPNTPIPLLHQGLIWLERGDEERAVAALDAAGARIERAKTQDPELRAYLAGLYSRAGEVSHAEDAARGLEEPAAKHVLAWSEQLRRKRGFPRGSVPPEREREYQRTLRQVDAMLDKRRFQEAEKVASSLLTAFPRAFGGELSLCEAMVDLHLFSRAAPHCAAAAERGSARASGLLGYALIGQGKLRSAVTALERAVDREPEERTWWGLLAGAYRATRQTRELSALAKTFHERFGGAL
jgi:tetratricopeptide (TPR) repeat protein